MPSTLWQCAWEHSDGIDRGRQKDSRIILTPDEVLPLTATRPGSRSRDGSSRAEISRATAEEICECFRDRGLLREPG